MRTTVKPLRRETPDFIIAPNLWLLNISDFSPVDYRILAMLQEWVCQHPVSHAAWFDEVITKMKWCSFFDLRCRKRE